MISPRLQSSVRTKISSATIGNESAEQYAKNRRSEFLYSATHRNTATSLPDSSRKLKSCNSREIHAPIQKRNTRTRDAIPPPPIIDRKCRHGNILRLGTLPTAARARFFMPKSSSAGDNSRNRDEKKRLLQPYAAHQFHQEPAELAAHQHSRLEHRLR